MVVQELSDLTAAFHRRLIFLVMCQHLWNLSKVLARIGNLVLVHFDNCFSAAIRNMIFFFVLDIFLNLRC